MACDLAGFQKSSKRTLRTIVTIIKAGITPSLISYFFWCAILYLATGVFSLVTYQGVSAFLCTIPAEGYQAGGCPACPDTLLMCDKGEGRNGTSQAGRCWQYAVNLTIRQYTDGPLMSSAEEYEKTALDHICSGIIKEAVNPVDALERLQEYKNSARPDMSVECIIFHCRVLKFALYVDEMNSLENAEIVGHKPCTNTDGMKWGSDAEACTCNAAFNKYAESVFETLDTFCAPLATVYKASMINNWANAYYQSSTPAPPPATPAPTIAPTPAATAAGSAAATSATPSGTGASQRRLDDPEVDEFDLADSDISRQSLRRLQTQAPATSAAINDQLQDFVEGPWTKCSCLQQCGLGVRTRAVDCASGSNCKAPRPASAQQCNCWHCAGCNIYMTSMLFSFGFLLQGTINLVLWLTFLIVASFEEDDYAGVGLCSKCLGALCKALPPIVRFMTFMTFGFLGVILYQAFGPGFYQYDCKRSQPFQAMAVLVAGVWLLSLVFGVSMARRQPMPPWLHYRSQNKLIKRLCNPCRKIGP